MARWRRRERRLLIHAVLPSLLLASACAPAARVERPAPRTGLAAVIDSVMLTPPLHRTHWGILVRDARTGATLYASEPERLFIPASNAKLVVGAVALAELGREYRYTTRVLAAGPTTGSDGAGAGGGGHGTLADVGELRVLASGDPTFSARFYPHGTAALDSLAARVRASGVRSAASLVIDASRFDATFVHPAWEVGDLPFTYAAPVAAFAVEEGAFTIVLHAGPAVGATGRAEVVGGEHRQPLVARVTTDTAGARVTRSVDFTARRDTAYLTATIALGSPPNTSRLAMTEPVRYAAEAFRDALRAHGVDVGAARIVYDTAQARLELAGGAAAREVARIVSPPMTEIVTAIQRPSQNWIAEMLLKNLGAERRGHGGWATGIDVERRWLLDVARLDSGSFSLRDASGLSAQNVMSPEATVRLLDFAATQPWGDAYRHALPSPGVPGGTLSGRLAGFENLVQAKTGTIANVNGLSGYLVTAAGRPLTFSILTNGSGLPAAMVRPAIDRIVEAIVREGGR
jgi:serine-type D-Ala-D-Ala carboxypeptidase/endopeptidase (penicillin-binding protein 4)